MRFKNQQKVEEKLWDNIDTSKGDNACWEWQGTRNSGGYGTLSGNENGLLAHRVAYEILVGEIPKGMFVCHKCDNPPCCNPSHLFLGTPKDNIRDMIDKGRHGDQLNIYDPAKDINRYDTQCIIDDWHEGIHARCISAKRCIPLKVVNKVIHEINKSNGDYLSEDEEEAKPLGV